VNGGPDAQAYAATKARNVPEPAAGNEYASVRYRYSTKAMQDHLDKLTMVEDALHIKKISSYYMQAIWELEPRQRYMRLMTSMFPNSRSQIRIV